MRVLFKSWCVIILVIILFAYPVKVNTRSLNSSPNTDLENIQQNKPENTSESNAFQRTTQIPFVIVDEHIIISAKLNDSIIVNLSLDTGFGSKGIILLDPELGKKLGLNYIAQIPLGGGGQEESKTANVARGVNISFPGVNFDDQQILVMSDKNPFDDIAIEGIIGGILFDYIVEIDYDSCHLNLYDQNLEMNGNLGEEFQLSFSYGIPVVEGEVILEEDTISVKLMIDTGAGLPFFLFTYSNEKFKPPVEYISFNSEGMGGIMPCKLGRVSKFKVGNFLFDNPLTAFADEKTMGTAMTLGQNGFLGHLTLQRFKVIFDYSRNKMFLKPNKNYAKEYDFNMAGLVLKTRGDGKMEVFDVVENSPAWGENIKNGDLITFINDIDVTKLNYHEIHEIFTQPGEKVKLKLERDSKSSEYTLILKRII